MKPKKIPMRMCVGCREMKPKRELIRVVRAPDGQVSIDLKGKAPGRGAYVCRSQACLARAIKQKQLERQLEAPLSEAAAEYLQQTLARLLSEEAGRALAGVLDTLEVQGQTPKPLEAEDIHG